MFGEFESFSLQWWTSFNPRFNDRIIRSSVSWIESNMMDHESKNSNLELRFELNLNRNMRLTKQEQISLSVLLLIFTLALIGWWVF